GRGRHGRSLRGGFGGELAAAFDAGAEALDELNEAKLVERTGLPVGAGLDRGRGRIAFRLRLPRQRRGGEGKGFVSVRHAGSELRSGSVERAYWRIRTKRARIGCNKRLRSVFAASGCRLGLFGQITQVERVVVADVTLVIVVMVFADRDRTAAGDRPAAYACETFGVELFMRVDRAARVAEAGGAGGGVGRLRGSDAAGDNQAESRSAQSGGNGDQDARGGTERRMSSRQQRRQPAGVNCVFEQRYR